MPFSRGDGLFGSAGGEVGAAEVAFDRGPPAVVAGVARRQGPDHVEVVGQNDPRDHVERVEPFGLTDSLLEQLDAGGVFEDGDAVSGDDGKEEGAAGL